MAPRGRLLGAPRRHHLPHHARQHGIGMLPTDQVEALASLVDEVERVASVGEGAVRRRGEQQARKRGWRGFIGDGGEQGAVRRPRDGVRAADGFGGDRPLPRAG